MLTSPRARDLTGTKASAHHLALFGEACGRPRRVLVEKTSDQGIHRPRHQPKNPSNLPTQEATPCADHYSSAC